MPIIEYKERPTFKSLSLSMGFTCVYSVLAPVTHFSLFLLLLLFLRCLVVYEVTFLGRIFSLVSLLRFSNSFFILSCSVIGFISKYMLALYVCFVH